MKILFKNKTKYSHELYLQYCNFHTKTNFIKDNLYTIAITILIFLFIVLQYQKHNYDIIAICFCALFGFIAWRYLYPMYLGKKEIKSEKLTNEKEYTFTFYEDYFTIEDRHFIYEMKYKSLYHICITDNYSYLYTQKRYAFVLDNSCFTHGTFANFKPFLHRKCKWKYKYYPDSDKVHN